MVRQHDFSLLRLAFSFHDRIWSFPFSLWSIALRMSFLAILHDGAGGVIILKKVCYNNTNREQTFYTLSPGAY
jgi:hypothetical protein